MDKGINVTIKNYLDLLRKKFSDIEKIYLFGSYAKGKSNKDSDIDKFINHQAK